MLYNVLLDTPLNTMTTFLLGGVYQLFPDVSSFQESLWLLKMKQQAFMSLPMWVFQEGGCDSFCLVGITHFLEHGLSACAHGSTKALVSRFVPLVLHYRDLHEQPHYS